WDAREMRLTLNFREQKLAGITLEQGGVCFLHPEEMVAAAAGKIIELSLERRLFEIKGRRSLLLRAAVWESGLPVDVVPAEGYLEIPLGEAACSWKTE
ncbi:MAG: hypothetical protein WB995_03260, partial [Candidatus Acidiferrales bacterium]